MKDRIKKALEYLKYPSTYKGLVAILSVVGVQVAPQLQESITTLGIAAYGVISLFFSDADLIKKK